MSEPSELDQGRAAFRARAWGDAFRWLSSADDAEALGPDDLWMLAMAAHLIGRDDCFVSALERAHRAHVEARATLPAARAAFWIGFRLAERGDVGAASGWLGRSARLVEAEGRDCVERGYLLMPAAHRQFNAGDYQGGCDAAGEAATIAQRFGDRDLLALAMHVRGRALIRQGRVDEGLALLDETMIAVASDELSPHVTGLIYCSVISACRDVWELRRAREWTAALADWCERQPELEPYRGQCRVYRAEILQLGGAWREAIAETERAARRVTPGPERAVAAAAFYQCGEAHRLLGELAMAEEAYGRASQLGREPQPGLALLRLAQGDRTAAAAAIRRVLAETPEPLRRARLLPAQIEIALAAGDPDEAERACAELAVVAHGVRAEFLEAALAQGRGAVALVRGDPAGALVALRRASEGWRALDAPYETARVRELIATACRALGDEDAAAFELEGARAVFEQLGAATDLARLNAPADGRAGEARSARDFHGLTAREREVLGLVATGRTNRAIGAELFISQKTVARHVSNIFAKLGLQSRAAATAWAYEHGLIEPPG